MHQIGDYVVKAGHGVCKIADITHLRLSAAAGDKIYYVISPIDQSGIKLYIPEDKMDQLTRNVISGDQAWELIKHIQEIEPAHIEDMRRREQKYREAIMSSDPEQLVSVIKNVYERKKSRAAKGKDETTTDKRFFKLLEESLYSELAFAIGKDKSEMKQVIASAVKGVEVH